MKAKIYGVLLAVMTVLSFVVIADTPYTQGTGIGVNFETEDFVPLVFLNKNACVVLHNNADGNKELVERVENYAFFGEQIICDILVVDKNGVPEKLLDVYMTVSESQEPSSDAIEANCNYVGPVCNVKDRSPSNGNELHEYNARIDEEILTCEGTEAHRALMNDIAGFYRCELTVETQTSMYGEYWVSAVAEDLDNQLGWAAEQMYWYLNPNIGIEVNGEIEFGVVRPDTVSYSTPLTLTNAADDGSGVLLSVFISGTDFVDPANSGARCPTSNVLELKNFAYFATNGAYHTTTDNNHRENGIGGYEGYYGIPYENGNEISREEIIEGDGTIVLGADEHGHHGVEYAAGNVLSPGADMTLTFRLYLPAPCNGDFTEGQIFLWAEAI